MGEGFGMLVFESFEYVEKCGVIIFVEVVGYGNICDVYYMILLYLEG